MRAHRGRTSGRRETRASDGGIPHDIEFEDRGRLHSPPGGARRHDALRRRPAPDGPLARPIDVDGRTVGNRFCILPMEGWDAESDGRPSERTFRRWRRFGASGAKLIWGGEAVAVRPDGRATPNELLIDEATLSGLAALRDALVEEHRRSHGRTDDLLVGLQLTHSGRFAGTARARPV